MHTCVRLFVCVCVCHWLSPPLARAEAHSTSPSYTLCVAMRFDALLPLITRTLSDVIHTTRACNSIESHGRRVLNFAQHTFSWTRNTEASVKRCALLCIGCMYCLHVLVCIAVLWYTSDKHLTCALPFHIVPCKCSMRCVCVCAKNCACVVGWADCVNVWAQSTYLLYQHTKALSSSVAYCARSR